MSSCRQLFIWARGLPEERYTSCNPAEFTQGYAGGIQSSRAERLVQNFRIGCNPTGTQKSVAPRQELLLGRLA